MNFDEEVDQIARDRASKRAANKKYPPLSVVLATSRPRDLKEILSQLNNQSFNSFELLIGLHKFSLDTQHRSLIKTLSKRKIKVTTFNFNSDATLGFILSQLSTKSTGQYIAKIDDDDIYGPEHLQDLMDVALSKSADVVGKAMNYVYVQALDITVRRKPATEVSTYNHWSDWVCGGTILVKRDSARAAGWFGEGKSAVDNYLLTGIKKNGGKIWRMPGLGYIYKRSLNSHTYATNYSKYLRDIDGQNVGIWAHPEFGTSK